MAYSATQREQCSGDLGDVFLLEKVDSLEDISSWDAVLLDSLTESTDVLHYLEWHRSILIDLLDAPGFDSVDQSGQEKICKIEINLK